LGTTHLLMRCFRGAFGLLYSTMPCCVGDFLWRLNGPFFDTTQFELLDMSTYCNLSLMESISTYVSVIEITHMFLCVRITLGRLVFVVPVLCDPFA
jgi:hypothetical protein